MNSVSVRIRKLKKMSDGYSQQRAAAYLPTVAL